MNRTEKQENVETLRQEFSAAAHAFLVDFKGLSVSHDTELRARLRAAEVRYQVVKNRLAKLALEGTVLAGLDAHFVGPTAVALAPGDPVAIAKVLVDFAKDHPDLKIKGGVLEGGRDLSATEVEALSKLPGLPEVRAQLLSLINSPATQLVRLLAEPGRSVVGALDARRQELEKS